MKFTSVVGIDNEHINELELTWLTWKKYKKELLANPILFVCDGDECSLEAWTNRLAFVDHPEKQIILWHGEEYKTQREKMLTSLVYAPAMFVKTDWFLKLDTDAVALNDKDFALDHIFENDIAFLASPWGYTKPKTALDDLDNWASLHPAFKNTKDLKIPYAEESNKVCCKRIISWLMFCRTDFAKFCCSLCPDFKLPVPSQDTYMWYVAKRLKIKYRTVRFKRSGWTHTNKKRLQEVCRSLL